MPQCRLALPLVALTLFAGACGAPTSSEDVAAGASPGATPSECGVAPYDPATGPPPSEPVQPSPEGCADAGTGDPNEAPLTGGPNDGNDGDGGDPQRVRPRPGMTDLHVIAWARANPVSQRAVDVYFWSGVEPCYVLDHVDVAYARRAVTITLYEGHDPSEEGSACIEIAVKKVVRVHLDEPLAERALRDGAP